jgi:hypothetical protein
VFSSEMEGFSKGFPTRSGTTTTHDLLFGHCTVGTDLSRIEANLCVAENVALKQPISWNNDNAHRQTYCEDVDEAHDNHYDPRGNDDPPERKSKRFLASCFLVEIAQDCVSK